jgi:hypothetical protein
MLSVSAVTRSVAMELLASTPLGSAFSAIALAGCAGCADVGTVDPAIAAAAIR